MPIPAPSAASSRPLLKWAGGKRQLLPALAAYYPKAFHRYVEAFLGSGAVFFDLLSQGRLTGREVTLADVNPDLIGCYRTLRDHTSEVIEALGALEREHRQTGATCYYDVRDRRFNPERAGLFAAGAAGRERLASAYPPELAAMLIFLNRTGFNGLFRLNRSGAFNVPAGRYTEPRICDADHLKTVADAFRAPGVSLELSGFEAVLAGAGPGDFVYCDPPYAPLSRTSSFANYTADGFTAADQARLRDAVVAAVQRGAEVVLSNSSAEEIVELYSTEAARQSGLRVHRVPARRMINSRATSRGPVEELIVSNVRPSLDAVRPRMLPAATTARRRKTA
jgi:DNA adenine methylase